MRIDADEPFRPENDIARDEDGPVEAVAVAPGAGVAALAADVRDRLMVDVIHDGATIPPAFLVDGRGAEIEEAAYRRAYWSDRDWGASAVAEALCRHLGLPHFHRVRVARVLLDFGRFPGCTALDAEYLQRFAINPPFSQRLGLVQKQSLLADCYDRIARHYDGVVGRTTTKIAIHTYDRFNANGTERPPISICSQALSYRASHQLASPFFDPLYPNELAEYTADRLLRDRLSLTFERAGWRVAHNYPYALPDGSVEVRAQVWAFFVWLRARYEEQHPERRREPGHGLVWDMLCDTNLRSTGSESLRGILHMFRRAPDERSFELDAARDAYEAIAAFVAEDRGALLRAYRMAPTRLSCIGVEVRKDVVWRFSEAGVPVGPRLEFVDAIGALLAAGVRAYLRDREDRAAPVVC